MTRLYQGQVSDSWFNRDGLSWYVMFGEARSVDGEPMVKLNHGIFPAYGWSADKAEAEIPTGQGAQCFQKEARPHHRRTNLAR